MNPDEVFYFATQGNKGIPSVNCSSHTGTVPPVRFFIICLAVWIFFVFLHSKVSKHDQQHIGKRIDD